MHQGEPGIRNNGTCRTDILPHLYGNPEMNEEYGRNHPVEIVIPDEISGIESLTLLPDKDGTGPKGKGNQDGSGGGKGNQGQGGGGNKGGSGQGTKKGGGKGSCD